MTGARDWASDGWSVTLVGLTSGQSNYEPAETVGTGSLEIIRVHRRKYNKGNLVSRLLWTVGANTKLLASAFAAIRQAEVVLFSGSPPLFLHFIAPLNVFFRKRLIYRIMDFHPECMIAERGQSGVLLKAALLLTYFWRRRVDTFEVLGLDQARRLNDIGIASDRIVLKPNASPVQFDAQTLPLPVPDELKQGSGVILYSGNWGVAHDEQTFIDGYSAYYRNSRSALRLWLNATGAKADRVERELKLKGVPIYRSGLVPLADLSRLLITADIHLVTLRDSFVGYVVPSKIHGCVDSGKRILFIGSENSDVHAICSRSLRPDCYFRVDTGNVDGLISLSTLSNDRSWKTERLAAVAPWPHKR